MKNIEIWTIVKSIFNASKKNCLKFSSYILIHVYNFFLLFLSYNSRPYVQFIFFVWNPSNFFIFSSPYKFSCVIFCFDTHLWLVAENYCIYIYIYILSNIFFLYNILKVKKIFFFSFFFCRINNPFCSIDCSLSCRLETCSSYLSFNFIFRGYLSHFFFFSSYCTVITCRLWSILYLLHKDMIFRNFQYFWSLINFFFI